VLLAAAVLTAVLLNTGSSGRSKRAGTRGTHHARHRGRARAHGGSAASASSAGGGSSTGSAGGSTTGSGATTATGSASAGAGAAALGATSGTGTPAGSSAAPSAGGSGVGASTPTSAVRSFYTLAAEHRYAEAWALADPTFREQLRGYESFITGQRGDISITFSSLRLISESHGAAIVAVGTTAERQTGTTHCAGTVALRSAAAAGWLLHLIDINCA
jgi:hypothetical protein